MCFEDRGPHPRTGRRISPGGIGHRCTPRHAASAGECKLFYWRERNYEVDFVVRAGRAVTAIEMKSGRSCDMHPGFAAFVDAFNPARILLVNGDGSPLEEFVLKPVAHWVMR